MHEFIKILAQDAILLSVMILLIAFLYLKYRDKKRLVIHLVIGGVLALIIAYLLRHIYYDPRPFVVGNFTPWFPHVADNGFVSDHTLLASFLAFTCIYYNRKIGLILLLLAVTIGVARVVGGVHHWIDIVSAFAVSLFSSYIAYLIVRKLVDKNTNRPDVK